MISIKFKKIKNISPKKTMIFPFHFICEWEYWLDVEFIIIEINLNYI